MFETLETGIGLDIVLWLQSKSSPLLDTLARVLNQLGLELAYIAALAVIYLVLDKGLGKRMVFTFVLGLVITIILKELFQRPRPFHLPNSGVTPLFEAISFGLPSGHVLITVLFWGYFALSAKRRPITIAVILYVLLQSWGRMVAGVHYPQDVIAGILIGLLLLWAISRIADRLEAAWDSQTITFQTIVVVVVGTMAALTFWSNANGQVIAGISLGGGIGFIIEAHWIHFSTDGTTGKRMVRILLGILVTIGVLLGLRVLFATLTPPEGFRILRYALTALVGLTFYPWLAMRMGITEREEE